MTSTAIQGKDNFLRRINQFGHDPEAIKSNGSQTTKVTVNGIQDLRALIGSADESARKLYQVNYDKLFAKKSPCDLGSVADAYIHGTGTLTSAQHAEIEPYFPTVVTLTSAVNYTLPPGQTTYGPNQPPVVLNYGILTIPYGSWITTLSTNLTLSATSVIVQPPSGSPPPNMPSYQIGIMGASQLPAAAGTAGTNNTQQGANGGGGGCIWGGGGCKNDPSGGSQGNPGGNGGPAANGQSGLPALAANITIGTLTGALNVASQGGVGQSGGLGGAGGTGSQGGNGGYGTSCGAASCNGGNGGKGGTGGNGGNGANGGNGGSAQTVAVTVTTLSPNSKVYANPTASPTGAGGAGGAKGAGGSGGAGGGSGSGGTDGSPGAQGDSGSAGQPGAAGTSSGPVGQIIVNQPS